MYVEGKYMVLGGSKIKSLEEHKSLEVGLHRELMSICRRYVNDIGIISVVGILDLVKQEIVDFDKAKMKVVKREELDASIGMGNIEKIG